MARRKPQSKAASTTTQAKVARPLGAAPGQPKQATPDELASQDHAARPRAAQLDNSGELHQAARPDETRKGWPEDRLTTNHGVPISDNQKSLKAAPAQFESRRAATRFTSRQAMTSSYSPPRMMCNASSAGLAPQGQSRAGTWQFIRQAAACSRC